jgi:hypothetical protein
MSKRRVGVEGLEPEGELYENSRRRLGVEGAVVALDEEALGRTGETGRRGEGGVTSVWSMDVNIAFACSFAASDSVGITLFREGVDGPLSSIRL